MDRTTSKISSIIHNEPLASDINRSILAGLHQPFVHIDGRTSGEVFTRSLQAAIRDIENHPRGELFRRLIEYGPPDPDVPEARVSDSKTTLSDPECGQGVQFIFYHMINRFKGELAELLAIEPCSELVQDLRRRGRLPGSIQYYMGNLIQERRRLKSAGGSTGTEWGGFTKGADGVMVTRDAAHTRTQNRPVTVHGVVEVKSMPLSHKKIQVQIDAHIARFKGGLQLGKDICSSGRLTPSKLHHIMVYPSTWKLSREWWSVRTEQGREIQRPEPTPPPLQNDIEEVHPNHWLIKLAWSQEAIEQAAYEMTFWYMSQVGKSIYQNKDLPRGWEYMTPEEAGYNAIKMMLYYIPLRYITRRQERLAHKLYNAYSFGYPFAADSTDMLWPEDFPEGR